MDLFKMIQDAIRVVMFLFDRVVYGLVPTLYELIVSLANVDLYNGNSVIGALINRVYVIIGIFMLFKLAFSVLRYIVDPNSFSDQAKGFTGLVKRILIALILLVSIPFIFSKIYEYQGIILNSHIISNLILGTNEDMGDLKSSATDLQFIMFGPFYTIDTTKGDLSACAPDDTYPLANVIGTTHMAMKGRDQGENGCLETFSKMMSKDSGLKLAGTSLKHFFKTNGGDERDFGKLGDLINWTVDGGYVIDYKPIISTICGGYLVFLLLSFCVDVAVRAIKLLFLQILSPIAIITSIDPTSSSQNDKLKDWGSECLKTYLSVFLRLAVIYVVIQLVRVITSKLYSGNIYNDKFTQPDMLLNIFVYIFLILGAFSVAKKIPELLEKAFGVKMSGELSMNPLNNFTQNAGFGLLAGAATGAVAGGISGGISAFTTSMNHEKGIGRSLLSGAGGMVSGSTTGTFRGAKAKGGKGWDAGMQSGGRIARRMEVRQATGGVTKIPAMTMDRLRDKMGAPTTYESREARAARYDEVGKKIEDMRARATDQLSKKSDAWKGIQAERTIREQWLKTGVDSSGVKYDQARYVADSNRFYTQEQTLITNYIDDGGIKDPKTGAVSQDGQLALHKQAFVKSVRDTKDSDFEKYTYDSKDATVKDETGKKISWKEMGADGALVKSSIERKALGIRSEPSFNDAFDRHQAIHGARTDAHMKH